MKNECYAVEWNCGDVDQIIRDTLPDAKEAAKNVWNQMTEFGKKSCVEMFIIKGQLNEDGYIDDGDVVETIKRDGHSWIVEVKGKDHFGDYVDEEYGRYDNLIDAEAFAEDLRREYPEEIVKVREV